MESVWTIIALLLKALLGEEEDPQAKTKPKEVPVVEQEEQVAAQQTKQTEVNLPESEGVSSNTEETLSEEEPAISEEEASEEEPKTVSDGRYEYEVPEEAPWWAPVIEGQIDAHTTVKGEEQEVSTIYGNGTTAMLDHPRNTQVDANGCYYVVSGDQYKPKIIKLCKGKADTVISLMDQPVAKRKGFFAVSGLAVINGRIFVSDIDTLYEVKNGHLTEVDPRIRGWMGENRFQDIFRMQPYKGWIYFLMKSKSMEWIIARYHPEKKVIEEVIDRTVYPSPYNFRVVNENEILITTKGGYLIRETIFPRNTTTIIDMGDPGCMILDAWIAKDNDLYFVVMRDQAEQIVYRTPKGGTPDDWEVIAGSRRGYRDGYKDEVEMDWATDFVWDGSGYVFSDMGNHAIRKLWLSDAPK